MLLDWVVVIFFWQLRLAYSDQREEIIFLETQLRARDAKITQLEKENQYLREKSQRWMKFICYLLLLFLTSVCNIPSFQFIGRKIF
jgi:hypothetical protein